MASFRKRSNRWQARVHPKGMPVVVKTFDTLADAEKWARAIERDNDLGVYTDRAKLEAITTAQLIERYRQEVVPQLRGAHTETIRLNTLARFLGNYHLAALAPPSCRGLSRPATKEGFSLDSRAGASIPICFAQSRSARMESTYKKLRSRYQKASTEQST